MSSPRVKKAACLHAHGFPHVRRLHFLPLDPQDWEASEAVVAIKVSEEVEDHIHLQYKKQAVLMIDMARWDRYSMQWVFL